MSINQKRTDAMKKRSPRELEAFVKSGSLAAAAAQYELNRRQAK